MTEVRLTQLDGIRGLAILLVIFCHATMAINDATGSGFFETVISLGGSGVTLFFVLSGFLISGLLLEERKGARRLGWFYKRRLLRIVPAYYFCLVVYSFLLPAFFPEGNGYATSWLESPWAHFSFVSNFIYFFKGGFSPEAMSISWSLAVEEQFYLIWPVIFLFLPVRFLSKACVLIALGALCLRGWMFMRGFNVEQVIVFTPARLDAFALGSLLALAKDSEGWWNQVKSLRYWVLTVAGFVAAGIQLGIPYMGSHLWKVLGPLSFSASAILYAALLAIVLVDPGFLAGFFQSRGMRCIGMVSYSAYLTHLGVLYGLVLIGVNPSPIFGEFWGQLVFYPIAVAASLLVGSALYFLVEKPAQSLRNQLL